MEVLIKHDLNTSTKLVTFVSMPVLHRPLENVELKDQD